MDDSVRTGMVSFFSICRKDPYDYRVDELFDCRQFYDRLGINWSIFLRAALA